MKGFPKTIKTRADFDNVKLTHPIETANLLYTAIDEVTAWVPVPLIGKGLIDDTHRVIEDDEGNKTQLQLVEDPNSLLSRIGVTKNEAVSFCEKVL